MHTVCFLLDLLFLPSTVNIVLDDVFQVPNNRLAASGLGVVARDNTGDLFALVICILVVEEELICFAVDDDFPLASWGVDMELTIFQPAGYAIFLAEMIDGFLLFAEPHANKGAAVTHTITGHPGFFRGGKLLFVLFTNSTGDLAVRQVEYFLSAFCAVKYHEGQLLSLYDLIIKNKISNKTD